MMKTKKRGKNRPSSAYWNNHDMSSKARYGIDAITHCCLEPHGTTLYWEGDKLKAELSTQNVSGTDDGFAGGLDITADDVDVHCDYIGGGFGSKFQPNYWGIAAAEIARQTGRPVKFMLTREQELKIAGNRPSGFIHVKLGADENGVVQVWDSHHWGTSGFNGSTVSVGNFPYVYRPQELSSQSDGDCHQQRALGGLASAQSSPGVRADADGLRRPGRQDASGQPRYLSCATSNTSIHPTRRRVCRATANRGRFDWLAQALASARQRPQTRLGGRGLGDRHPQVVGQRQQLELLC